MRSRRSVTITPIFWPLRSLKIAMSFFARVTTGDWPVIDLSSSTAVSMILGSSLALPRPMLTRDLDEPRHLHRILVVELLHQRVADGAVVRRACRRGGVSRLYFGAGPARLGGLLALPALALALLGALFLLGSGVRRAALPASCLSSSFAMTRHIPALGNLVPDFTPTRTFLSSVDDDLGARAAPELVVEQRARWRCGPCLPCRRCRPAGSSASGFVWRLIIVDLLDDRRGRRRRAGPCRACPCPCH